MEKGGINCGSSLVAKIFRGIELTWWKTVLSQAQLSVWAEAVDLITYPSQAPTI